MKGTSQKMAASCKNTILEIQVLHLPPPTILDMHTKLGHMNRLQEIKVTNPDIKFPKHKHNNDFIWDKQFPQDQRKQVCDLKDYPSEEEVECAWKEGVDMARQLARKLGMHPNDNEPGDETSECDDK